MCRWLSIDGVDKKFTSIASRKIPVSYQDHRFLYKPAIRIEACARIHLRGSDQLPAENEEGENLAAAIRAAYAGRSTLSPEVTRDLIATNPTEPVSLDLTTREMQVLALMVNGLTNPQIAEHLSISRATASSHVSHILQKLGVSNRAEAIVFAMRNNLID